MTEIRCVGVVGGGLMGSGIAQVAAQGGYATILRELDEGLAARARAMVERSLAKAVEKGKATAEERDAALAKTRFVTSLDELAECDLVIEAVVESLEVKAALWAALDVVAPAHAIFATNTSSLGVGVQGVATQRPDRFVGMHFFNPVPAMKLVEIVRSLATSAETIDSAFEFARKMGKEPILAKDTPGFVVNLLLVPYMLDAIRALESGIASVHDIDVGMQLGAGHPMGPLALSDFVGLDTLVRVADIMYDAYREQRHAPPPLLRRMVVAGWWGKKNGRGFYDYRGATPVPNVLMG